jgi:Fe-S-cluster formation regulator IscX/YfhJ
MGDPVPMGTSGTTTISWTDLEALVDVLRAAHPRVDPRALDDAEVQALVDGLDGVETSGSPCPGDFEALRAMWHWGA